jgi:DNA-binding CsgD family transcriptional regulator
VLNDVFATATATATANTIINTEVRIWMDGDEHANRVSAVLEALGYTVLRELDEGDAPARLSWAINRLAQRHKLTLREQDILERVLAGRSNHEISRELEISRATVKWHMHNIFAKTNTAQREGLLRLALQLGGARSPDCTVDRTADRARELELVFEPHGVLPAEAVPSKAWF